MKVFTISFSERPPTMPMTIAMMKNHVEASSKYHWPIGRPVTIADQPCEVWTSDSETPSTVPSMVVTDPFESS